ncbi:MAG: hypothetical protein PGN34_24295 [Methylobacterium frigidaeris]
MFELRSARRFVELDPASPAWTAPDAIEREHHRLLSEIGERCTDVSHLDERLHRLIHEASRGPWPASTERLRLRPERRPSWARPSGCCPDAMAPGGSRAPGSPVPGGCARLAPLPGEFDCRMPLAVISTRSVARAGPPGTAGRR